MGDILFILNDTFIGDIDQTTHSYEAYTEARVDGIKALMERCPDEKVIQNKGSILHKRLRRAECRNRQIIKFTVPLLLFLYKRVIIHV